MSKTLTLTHGAFTAARQIARSGRPAEALLHLDLLLARTDLTVELAADARRLAAELELDRGHYGKARRHLRAALAIEPTAAATCALVAKSFEDDPHGSDERAAKWYRKAMRFAPSVANYAAAFGRAAVRCGKVKAGLKGLRLAATAAPGDLRVLWLVTDGLIAAGRITEARRAVVRARFLRTARPEVLAKLDGRVRFEAARRQQERAARVKTPGTDGASVVLPFVRLVGGEARPAAGGAVRRDVVSFPRPHFLRQRVGRG